MNDELEERSWFFRKQPGKTNWGGTFTDLLGRKLRYASRIGEAQGLKFAVVQKELTLRVTQRERYEIKATVLEDERAVKTLTIQKYSSKTGPLDKQYFTFTGSEITNLIDFIIGIKATKISDEGKFHLSDQELRDIVLDQGQARRIFAGHQELFLEIARSEELTRDLIAVGYRRKQLERFQALLDDQEYFEAERARLSTTPEGVWQKFFEANTWIFGYGLSYHFLTNLDDKKLEQIIHGSDVSAAGKRTDALMKTRGLISSLCFVEIKRHDTALLSSQTNNYRPDAWSPSSELCGGVVQVQATVQAAIEKIGRKLTPTDSIGNPTGEMLFNVEPRSFLIIGSLAQFQAEHGINEPKFRSFEMYRRNTRRPEILTFDELLERALFIVGN